VTNSIFIGRHGFHLETSAGTSDRELAQIDRRPPMPAEEVTKVYIPLGLMQTSLRSRLCHMLHGRHIKDKKNEIGLGNFTLDSRSHQAGYAAFT
jgi:hypothetical protein